MLYTYFYGTRQFDGLADYVNNPYVFAALVKLYLQ